MPIEVEMLRQIPIFAPLAQADLEQVARVTVERQFDRGDIIFLEGRPNGALHYLCSGLVKVFKTSLDGREQVLRLIGAGNTFNEVPALDGGPNPASAAAMEACTIYVIQRTELRKLIVERPAVAEAVVQVLASALRHLVTLVEDLSFRHVTARVARLLLDQEAATMPAGASARRLTQQEMGAIVGTAREVVGRALKELEVAGAIEMRQGRAVVVDRERLGLLAQG